MLAIKHAIFGCFHHNTTVLRVPQCLRLAKLQTQLGLHSFYQWQDVLFVYIKNKRNKKDTHCSADLHHAAFPAPPACSNLFFVPLNLTTVRVNNFLSCRHRLQSLKSDSVWEDTNPIKLISMLGIFLQMSKQCGRFSTQEGKSLSALTDLFHFFVILARDTTKTTWIGFTLNQCRSERAS